ncbi:Glu/Leu/Phe/Val family dehydrogenase [Novispirillum sp. DQ9]|uniref:Glu/Leu/Phe/Val family dehydrogenase n=1 Tax=Novispirillum sp. DQ9 TaxID=3398612 RepID=UPI003C7EC05D
MLMDLPDFDDHEMVVFCRDADSGLRAIIAVHSTVAGPACGGTRMWRYADEAEAVTDVLRLSRGMTYKNVMAGLPLGGGKSVIIGDPGRDKSEALLTAFARKVDSLGGTYIAAEDVGTSPADMAVMARVTEHVAGRPDRGGDPSPVTAFGVYHGIKAAARACFGSGHLTGRIVAIQGLGHVGWALAERLAKDNVRLLVTDINKDIVEHAVRTFGAQPVDPPEIHAADADIFAPCALGGILTAATIPEIKARVVAGAANNQLATPDLGPALHQHGILYAPDYVINAGGIISVASEVAGHWDRDSALNRARDIGKTLTEIFRRAKAEGLPTAVVADEIARERLAALKARREAA